MAKRKPKDRKPQSKLPADVTLNNFLKEKGILLAMAQMQISKGSDGSITLRPTQPTAVYVEDVPKRDVPPAPGAPVSGNGTK